MPLMHFPLNNFKHFLTLFSKVLSSFPHGTCPLLVSYRYLALEGMYLPIRIAFSTEPTRRKHLVERLRPWMTGFSPSLTSPSREFNAISKTNLMNNFAKLAMLLNRVTDELICVTDECSLFSDDHFDACNKQAHRGICNRDITDSPFGGVHKIRCMDPLQHTPVGGGPLWYGEANSVH